VGRQSGPGFRSGGLGRSVRGSGESSSSDSDDGDVPVAVSAARKFASFRARGSSEGSSSAASCAFQAPDAQSGASAQFRRPGAVCPAPPGADSSADSSPRPLPSRGFGTSAFLRPGSSDSEESSEGGDQDRAARSGGQPGGSLRAEAQGSSSRDDRAVREPVQQPSKAKAPRAPRGRSKRAVPRGIEDEAGVSRARPRKRRAGPVQPRAEKDPKAVRHQYWFLTRNNWTDTQRRLLEGLPTEYLCYQPEIGENGTPHLQGWFSLRPDVKRSFNQLRSSLGTQFHLEELKGTFEQVDEYCSKVETRDPGAEFGVVRRGSIPDRDRRGVKEPTLGVVAGAALDGMPLHRLACRYPVSFLRHHSGLAALISAAALARDPSKPPDVRWYWGGTASGKTRAAWSELGTGAYCKPSEGRWWDSYRPGQLVIWDEFRETSCSFQYLLSLLDRYPLQVEVKGGHVQFNSPVIIVTCPYHPRDVYTCSSEDVGQLLRRISVIKHFKVSVVAGERVYSVEEGDAAGADCRRDFSRSMNPAGLRFA